jgi:mannose-6-phosphate isomerase-like protein (cupin superfamily)
VITSIDAAEVLGRSEEREVVVLTDRPGLSVTWSRFAAGRRGAEPHVHHEHTDCFYVVAGELTVTVGPERERVTLGAGGFFVAPPDVVHGFDNDGDEEVRYLNLHTPDRGFIAYMRAIRDGTEVGDWDSFDPPADGGRPREEAVVSRPGEGDLLVSGPRSALMKCARPDISFAEWTIDGPVAGPDLHAHADAIDSFYVLDGELDVTLGGEVRSIGSNTLAAVPVGTDHSFGRSGPGSTRLLNFHTPDRGFADFLRRASG